MPKVIDGVERKTTEEIDAIANEAKNEIVKARVGRHPKIKTEGINQLESTVMTPQTIGVFNTNPAKQDSAMQKVFKKIDSVKDGWIKMSAEDVDKLLNVFKPFRIDVNNGAAIATFSNDVVRGTLKTLSQNNETTRLFMTPTDEDKKKRCGHLHY